MNNGYTIFVESNPFLWQLPNQIIEKLEEKSIYSKEFSPIFRGVYSINFGKESFLPSIIERTSKANPFADLSDISMYGVSLNLDASLLKHQIESNPYLSSVVVGIAKGYTQKSRGYSIKSLMTTHVNYYLFDWDNNNPCCDFNLIERL